MDRPKPRKGQGSRKFPCDTLDYSSNERDNSYNDKFKYKKNYEKKKYEASPNPYMTNYSAHARMHPFAQRTYSASDSPICHYSVPLSFSLEPFSLPVYSTVIPPHRNKLVPVEIETHSSRSKHHKNKKAKNISKEVPALFHTPRIKNGEQQDYTSLPPVNCNMYAPMSNVADDICKRRFSDPGIGQMSSDDCSSSRSENSNKSSSTAAADSHNLYTLFEQMNDLKETNSTLKKELQEAKLELESLKVTSLAWKRTCDDFKPGALSDAINEIRTAVKLGQEALVSKVIQMLEKNTLDCKQAQVTLEDKLKHELNERLLKLEGKMRETSQNDEISETSSAENCAVSTKEDSTIQQQLVELEQEKLQLRKELQEAVAKRKSAEATTEKLERLVGVLRKKINGVSLDSCISDEKQILVRPLASSLEKNPFIIANNRQGQKSETLPFTKGKLPTSRSYSQENLDLKNLEAIDDRESESVEPGTNDNLSTHMTSDNTSVTAQVTITGPVTDL